MRNRMFAGAIAMLICAQIPSAIAVTQAGSPATTDPSTEVPDPTSVTMPDLGDKPLAGADGAFDKYYFFHRDDVSFASALADLRECDDFARGAVTVSRLSGPVAIYGNSVFPRADGSGETGSNVSFRGPSVTALGDAFLSADARKARRINMRRCMHYKGYQRFGIDKTLWQKFNFEEGYSSIAEADRQYMLAQQAKVASTPGIARGDLGL